MASVDGRSRYLTSRNLFMSYHAGDDPDVVQPWFLRKTTWIIAAVVFFLLAAGVGILTYVNWRKIPEIGGGLTLEADPNTSIYIGDKLVGTARVTFTWEELFGDDKLKPIALELHFPAGAGT